MKTRILFTGILLAALFTFSQAQTTEKETPSKAKTTQGSFIDANNDGVCDNFEARAQNGIQGNTYRHGQGQGKALKNCQGYRNGAGNGCKYKKGNGQGQGDGQGEFVDANNDGVCDNKE